MIEESASLFERQAAQPPPRDPEIEAALLAALLHDNGQYDRVSQRLRPEHFFEALHARIYEALSAEIEAGRRVDGRSLAAALAASDPQAAEYIRDLPFSMVNPDAWNYARLVLRLHQRRQLIEIAAEMSLDAREADVDGEPLAIAEHAADRLFVLQDEQAATGGGARPMAETITDTLQWLDDVHEGRIEPGLPTGLTDLDRILGGLGPSRLSVLAGRPSMGKSALALRLARHVARQVDREGARRVVGFFSFEMSAQELHLRLMSEITGIPYRDMSQRGQLDTYQRQAIAEAGLALRDLNLEIDESSGLTPPQIAARCRAIKRRRGRLDLIVIDHLGHVRPTDPRATNSQVERLGQMTKALKAMAKHFACPVLLLCQLNRGVEQRDDKRPVLSDLRESGQIEEDADSVMMLYRSEYYLERSMPQQRDGESQAKFDERFIAWQAQYDESQNKAEVFVPKNRQGAVGSVSLYCNIATNTFDNLAGDRQ